MATPFFHVPPPLRCALFMSGSGTNAEVLLRTAPPHLHFVLMVTDAPQTSRAAELARAFGLPLAALDIRAFYRERGLASISLATEAGREARDAWTAALADKVLPYRPECGILAGFLPLTNLTGRFPCLNVHPGDLTVERDGKRILAGLHFRPTERAIQEGFTELRSSVILAQPYVGNGAAEMDSGPVLGISEPMALDLRGRSHADFADPSLLREVAEYNVERLKFAGDHVVFPAAAENFGAGLYAMEGGVLQFKANGKWIPVRTVEYGRGGRFRPIRLS